MNLETLQAAFPEWRNLARQVSERFAPDTHGDMPRWQMALARLPDLAVSRQIHG